MKILFRCSDRQNCTIPVTSKYFGDPCPKIPKYIEAHYICDGKFAYSCLIFLFSFKNTAYNIVRNGKAFGVCKRYFYLFLRVLLHRCTQNQNCSIPASTSMFGDPCAGTHKYLEAHYQCLPGKFLYVVVEFVALVIIIYDIIYT